MFLQDISLVETFPFLAKSVDTFSMEERLFYEQLEWLPKLPTNYQSILDVGCGPGYQSKFFELMGRTVTACDKNDRFLFKDAVKFMACALEETPPTIKYDAIFISHVAEHIINLGNFFDHLKKRLGDGGYLFIVVPCTRVTENGHWLEGWSIPQLAMMLASLGFDCRDSFFGTWNYSTVGFGKKTDRKGSDFIIDECLSFLPKTFAELRSEGQNSFLYRNVTYADNKAITRTTPLCDRINALGLVEFELAQTREQLAQALHTLNHPAIRIQRKLWRALRFWR